jgi:hypothetical protein
MNPYVLLIGNQELVVNIVAKPLGKIIFNNPLSITYPGKQEVVLNVPNWLRCTPDRDFTMETSKITMILMPTSNLKDSYIKIITDYHEAAKKAREAAAKTKDAPKEAVSK